MSDVVDRWRAHGEPLPTSAVRTTTGDCSYEDCPNGADYLVKVETADGVTAKTKVCQDCSDEHRIWAERHLPPSSIESEPRDAVEPNAEHAETEHDTS